MSVGMVSICVCEYLPRWLVHFLSPEGGRTNVCIISN